MKWKYDKQLSSKQLISEFEKLTGFSFPESFVKCVTKHNGGSPESSVFYSVKKSGGVVERDLKMFLSFEKNDRESVWKIKSPSDSLVPFAIDNFGNLICFERSSGKIVFWNHESNSIEKVAKSFDEFMILLC